MDSGYLIAIVVGAAIMLVGIIVGSAIRGGAYEYDMGYGEDYNPNWNEDDL